MATWLIGGALKAQPNREVRIMDKKGKSIVLYKESHALIIWVGDYKAWSKLINVEREANDVKAVLVRQGFNVRMVGNPTGQSIMSEVQDFIATYGYKRDNRLVIFYTGHGDTRNRDKGYLVPVDAPDPTLDETDFLRKAVSMEQVMTWARNIESKHVLFVFDSCFSGTVFKTKSKMKLDDSYIRTVIDKPVRQFLAAGDAGQKVPAKSVFTPLLVRALKGEADFSKDGYVTGSELGLFLTQKLPGYTNNSQSPQYGKIRDVELDQGDIVFRPPPEPVPTIIPEPPSYCNQSTRNQTTYWLCASKQTWYQADLTCKKSGSSLVLIEDEDEDAFLFKQIQRYSLGDTWIGLTDQETENYWTWNNDNPLAYSNWDKNPPNNEPNNGMGNFQGGEDCAVIMNKQPGRESKWDDRPCNLEGYTYNFICRFSQ
ncbi:lectin-like protein [Candidatus Cyanaurora vandensis]|uniref:lectin-like protein n=1 Tax=Candidatus Cyanaurora vandensis TaxID=2714958 RepID=UPI00257CB4D9|nr:lectin-like protein [Candidatus Cyanaurora vandensis]